MRERAKGKIVACRISQLPSTASVAGAVYVPVIYDMQIEVQIGEAVVPVHRFQASAPRSSVGDTVEVEWENGRLHRVINTTAGEVLLDKREDLRVLTIAAVAMVLLVALVVGLAVVGQ